MKNATFKRKELKYLITDIQRKELMRRLGDSIAEDIYTKYTICNIYYDNDYFDSYNQSVQNSLLKEKIRERAYLNNLSNNVHYIELKKKYNGITYKRRVSVLETNSQIQKEIDWKISKNNFHPFLFISYYREAYIVNSIRITFDENIKYRNDNLDDIENSSGSALLENKISVMEIKTDINYPIWLTSILTDLSVYPCSFSKYKMCFEKSFKGGIS